MSGQQGFSSALKLVAVATLMPAAVAAERAVQAEPQYAWRYYRPSNTGIQGDYNEAIWIGADGDPWIGGYNPSFEEGGVARFVQKENRWINISNVDYPAIGHPNDTGVARVSDIVADAQGNLWLGTWRGALTFNPDVGPSSIVKYGPGNSALPGGRTTDVEVAPDGTLWFSAISVSWGGGGITRHDPATGAWTFWQTGDRYIAAQPRPLGGYYVWSAGGYSGNVFRFDSATQAWTTLPQTGAPGEIAALPGKDCTDDAGNTWMLRVTSPGAYHSLDYRRPDGTWAAPPEPFAAITFDIWAFRAFGNAQALLADGNGNVWRFNGTAWSPQGQWRPGAYTSDVNIDEAGNLWACGTGGAARRDVSTGLWQRYRVTNTSQYDFFNRDLSIEENTSAVYACANAGSGYGGMVKFDGTRWIGVNNYTYGLGIPWPFPTDNSESVSARPSLGPGVFAVNPVFYGIHQYNGSTWTMLLAGGTSKGMVEDSLGRLWSVGEYFDLRYHNGSGWTTVPIACWGANIQRDPDRPGTVWACANCEVVRTDGVYRFSRQNTQLPGLNPQSDVLTTVAAGRHGIGWVGSTRGVHRLDAESGDVQHFPPGTAWLQGGSRISPLAVTPDGRLWFTTFGSPSANGLGWYDGSDYGFFPAPPGGEPQWGGLPHAQIVAAQMRLVPGGYELWMSCLSRGIAVLTVTTPLVPGDIDGDGDVDLTDRDLFVGVLLGTNTDPDHVIRSDLTGEGSADGGDVAPFVVAVLAG